MNNRYKCGSRGMPTYSIFYLEELASPEVEHELGIEAEVLGKSEALGRILVELAKLLAQPELTKT